MTAVCIGLGRALTVVIVSRIDETVARKCEDLFVHRMVQSPSTTLRKENLEVRDSQRQERRSGKMEALWLNPLPHLLPRTPFWGHRERRAFYGGNSIYEELRIGEKFVGMLCEFLGKVWLRD